MKENDSRIVFIKDPEVLPENISHADVVENLAKANKAVILLSHGNKYFFPEDWTLPHNVTLFEYDLEMSSIQACVTALRKVLHTYGVEIYSRHLIEKPDPMPMVLSGSLLTMNLGTQVEFINNIDQYAIAKIDLETKSNQRYDWDIYE